MCGLHKKSQIVLNYVTSVISIAKDYIMLKKFFPISPYFQNLASRSPLCLPNSFRLLYSYHPLFYLPSPHLSSPHTHTHTHLADFMCVTWAICLLTGRYRANFLTLEVQTCFSCNCFLLELQVLSKGSNRIFTLTYQRNMYKIQCTATVSLIYSNRIKLE